MVFAEFPNMSEPNPEFLAQQKIVSTQKLFNPNFCQDLYSHGVKKWYLGSFLFL